MQDRQHSLNFFDSVLVVASASRGGVLDHAINAEEAHHKDFLRLVSDVSTQILLLQKNCNDSDVSKPFHVFAEPYRRIPRTVLKNPDLLFNSCGKVGC